MEFPLEIIQLRDNIIQVFGENARSILLYGSTVLNKESNDIDFIVILKEKDNTGQDLDKLRTATGQLIHRADAQLIYEKELCPGNAFSLDTHGPFIVEQLKQAVTLHGDNPFVDISISVDVRKASVLQKIQYYTFRARQIYFGYALASKDKSSDFHRKKIVLAMQDLIIAKTGKSNGSPVNIFVNLFPNVLSVQDISYLSSSEPLQVAEALPLYEKLYDIALSMTKDIFSEPSKPLWWKIGDIFCEYVLPQGDKDIYAAVILCDGLPSAPYQRILMNILSEQGFSVFFPRYSGTWESGGVFLQHSPAEDIALVAHALQKGITLGNNQFVAQKVVLIGTSFGGAVAISAGKSANADQIVALSPVIDFTKLIGIDSLQSFLKTMFAGAYRFEDEGWRALVSGELINPKANINGYDNKKILIMGGENDKEILSVDLKEFAHNLNILCHIFPAQGHLSFSKVKGQVLDEILNFIVK